MNETELERRLADFAHRHKFRNKGSLCVALVLTDRALSEGLPLPESALLVERGGQVRGLGKGGVQAILARHGITRVLAEEGGRTSRGSIDNARQYMSFLNSVVPSDEGDTHLHLIEGWWVQRVRDFFARNPFRLRLDEASSVRAVIRDLLSQAHHRQQETQGAMVVGTVLQHLVGAKLEILQPGLVQHHGASVADHSTDRPGDFVLGDCAVHVTTAPGEALIRKCRANLSSGYRPWIITTVQGVAVAEGLAHNEGLDGRIDICDIEQLVTCDWLERGDFSRKGRQQAAERLVDTYNAIIERCETDPGLRIEIG